jgi:hypothetical protein
MIPEVEVAHLVCILMDDLVVKLRGVFLPEPVLLGLESGFFIFLCEWHKKIHIQLVWD